MSTASPPAPSVAILLATLHGYRYLREQLDSIEQQSHRSWSIYVSDDGSDERTLAILRDYKERLGAYRFSIRQGPAKGFASNFLSLACNREIAADYYAYADQDDIWYADKLKQALSWLQSIPVDIPALYCARTCNVDAKNSTLGFSKLRIRPATFANALVENIASGNTMVCNHAAQALLKAAGPLVRVAAHDWWTYQLISGCGGVVFYDPKPSVRYRQHDANLIGSSRRSAPLQGRLTHAGKLLRGQFRQWNGANIAALQGMRAHLTAEHQAQLDAFSQARQGRLPGRLVALVRAGVYRQSWIGNVGLIAAVVLNKL
jgi:glycosyltransferase involved in cell wall biosynthesis